MEGKAVIAFDKEVTPRIQEIVNEAHEKLRLEGVYLDAIGGGVKVPPRKDV